MDAAAIALFFSGFVVIVLMMGIWSRLMLRRAGRFDLHRRVSRFNRAMFLARLLIPAWLGVGIFELSWRSFVGQTLGLDAWPFDLPSLMLGTAPCYLTWMGLWWSGYPIERAMRENNILAAFDQSLPVHAPPDFRSYFAGHFRLQILFTLIPIFLILAVTDLIGFIIAPMVARLGPSLAQHLQQTAIFASVGVIYLISPLMLCRILRTQPLADSPLRRRLLAIADRQQLKVRQILLWHTHHNIANAAVMGIVGRFRYVLLSDLLIETMPDEQIEAVFAHEIGHLVHRHMQWYLLLIVSFLLILSNLDAWAARLFPSAAGVQWLTLSADAWLSIAAGMGFVLIFGIISRRFERQADVFAARSMIDARHEDESSRRSLPPVHPESAATFIAALQRVAVINHIPLHRRQYRGGGVGERLAVALDRAIEWMNHFLHGSILHRTRFIRHLGDNPAATARFDRNLRRLKILIFLTLVASLIALFLT